MISQAVISLLIRRTRALEKNSERVINTLTLPQIGEKSGRTIINGVYDKYTERENMYGKHQGPEEELQALDMFFNGGYCSQCADIDKSHLSETSQLLHFLILSFTQRVARKKYVAFDGDLVSALIVTEIWLYNVGRMYARHRRLIQSRAEHGAANGMMPGCNTYSIALSLGLPPETVRRKVKKLVAQGWISKTPDGELLAVEKIEKNCDQPSRQEMISEFLSVARHVLALADDGSKLKELFNARG